MSSESEAPNGKTGLSVHFAIDNVEQFGFKLRLKVLRSLADLHSYDSEFETEGALTMKAFCDNAITIRGILKVTIIVG